MEKTKLVCLGDSVGTNYRMKVRTNTFSELLARRLNLEPRNYAIAGATTGHLLGYLKDNEEIINDVKDSKVVVIACGTNNVLITGLMAMAEAINIPPNWRMPGRVMTTLATNPAKALKMVAALNSAKTKEAVKEGVDAFKEDMPKLIDRIQELNSEAIIVVATIYILSDVSRNIVYKVATKSQAEIADDMNSWLKNNLPQKNVIIADFAQELRNYKGTEELSNLNDFDFHLSDNGHIFAYNLIYDLITDRYPELITEEGDDVIQIRKRKETKTQQNAEARTSSEIVRDIVEKTVNRDDLEYDENKQFREMGIPVPEVFSICDRLEKECFDGKDTCNLPSLGYCDVLRPTFFIDYLEGKPLESVMLHRDLLPHFASLEEKQETEKNDSESMKILKKHIYNYLNDDMVKLTDDTTYFGTLHFDYEDWFSCLYPAETEFNFNLEIAHTPSPETVTLKEIADYAEKLSGR